jgi:predicted HAD superfamily Cof-like phosphohydrolase
MKTNFELVKEFHAAFNDKNDPEVPTIPNEDIIELRVNLITEEFDEVLSELGYVLLDTLQKRENNQINISNLAKELADLLYVVYGTAASFGLPIDDVYREVHRSNMSKLGEDGKPIYREDGKVLKGPNYKPADIEKIINKNVME